MKLSARNQFSGVVTNVKEGAVNGIVSLKSGNETITGTISMNAINELGLKAGCEAVAIIKATEVMIGIGEMKLSARNMLRGKVASINEGVVNAIVTLELSDGQQVTSTISMNAVKELGLEVGVEAVAVIKATSVMFGA